MNFENIASFSFAELGKYSDIVAIDHSLKLYIYIYIYTLSPRSTDILTPSAAPRHICSCPTQCICPAPNFIAQI